MGETERANGQKWCCVQMCVVITGSMTQWNIFPPSNKTNHLPQGFSLSFQTFFQSFTTKTELNPKDGTRLMVTHLNKAVKTRRIPRANEWLCGIRKQKSTVNIYMHITYQCLHAMWLQLLYNMSTKKILIMYSSLGHMHTLNESKWATWLLLIQEKLAPHSVIPLCTNTFSSCTKPSPV